MTTLNALLLSDGRPGHYHLAEGVLAAIARRRPVQITRLNIKRRPLAPARILAALLARNVSPALVLRLGYGIDLQDLMPDHPPVADQPRPGASPPNGELSGALRSAVTKAGAPEAGVNRSGAQGVHLVVSAGGQTIAANIAAARALGASNIFCGSLRHVAPQSMALTISSYASHAARTQHIVALKPSGIDPGQLGAPGRNNGTGNPPALAGLLIGGKSGQFTFDATDWDQLLAFISASHQAHGTSWIVSTSRRTDADIADRLGALARHDNSPINDYIDFRTAGPGTLPSLFARAQAILCTADSSTMMSEAVCARRPVIGITPAHHSYTDQEAQYRQFMLENNWTRTLPLANLSPANWLDQLAQVKPLKENHLDRLADELAKHLPHLFEV